VASVAPYLIFYDGGPHSEAVHVLRILHGRRDITLELISRGRDT
jgi:plasmid stabilization system protein ParE